MASATLRELVRRWPDRHDHWPYLHEFAADDFRAGWRAACRRFARDGRIPELHAARDDYQATFKAHLQILDALLVLTGQSNGHGPPEHLHHARRELQRLHDEIFSDWHTEDDLAEKIITLVSIPNERLLEIARQNPPPQSWFDETDDPFTAAE